MTDWVPGEDCTPDHLSATPPRSPDAVPGRCGHVVAAVGSTIGQEVNGAPRARPGVPRARCRAGKPTHRRIRSNPRCPGCRLRQPGGPQSYDGAGKMVTVAYFIHANAAQSGQARQVRQPRVARLCQGPASSRSHERQRLGWSAVSSRWMSGWRLSAERPVVPAALPTGARRGTEHHERRHEPPKNQRVPKGDVPRMSKGDRDHQHRACCPRFKRGSPWVAAHERLRVDPPAQ
jgi:hypothetical protein